MLLLRTTLKLLALSFLLAPVAFSRELPREDDTEVVR
jgi:hypothetical protein